MKYILLFILSLNLQAGLMLSPFDAMKINFGDDARIEKKNILLNTAEAKAITQLANTKLNTKIYRVFRAYKEDTLLGYGVLVLHKVRSKDTAVLSIIALDGSLKALEIIAFNEPMEYLPSVHWTKVFKERKLNPRLALGKDIPSISGSTLSARATAVAARIALALFEVKYKK